MGPRLNNVTIYVGAAEFAATCAFYRSVFPEVVYDDGDHIMCFAAGTERSVCVHVEGELGREAGEVESIYWVDDLEAFRSDMTAIGLEAQVISVGLQLRDPTGRVLRFITPPA